MGKKVRNKARNIHKEKRVATASPKTAPHENDDSNADIVNDGALLKDSRGCVHIHKAIDLEKFSSKIESGECIGCEDCRVSAIDRRACKGKNKQGKKKAVSGSKSESKATWVCLQCGHFACGGVGLPTTPQSHAVRHSRQYRHPLVIQFENPQLRWCFSCNTLISDDKLEDTGEQKDVFSDIVKLLKKQSSKVNSVDVEDVWFGSGSGSVVSELKAENKESSILNGKDLFTVKGLVNLGNTCFFNSVMQNLLAMDILRDYILKYDGSAGPLTSSLKKVILEINLETGQKNVINPRPLFGCVCSKAPQFRGYQQQDSHELLRCLLDGLASEDSCAKKYDHSSSENRVSGPVSCTFVDAIFGGRLSSTVCCVECGYSSVVYEPFLDLSLPVPTRKPPLKKAQPVSRARKAKLPPKLGGRNCSNLKKGGSSVPVVNGIIRSVNDKASSDGKEVDCPSSADHIEPANVGLLNGSIVPQNSNNNTEPDTTSTNVKQNDEQDADCFAWMDYLEPISGSVSQECDDVACLDHYKAVSPLDPNLATENKGNNCCIVRDQVEAVAKIDLHDGNPMINPESTVDDLGDERLAQVQDNQVLLLPYKEDDTSAIETSNSGAATSMSAVAGEEDSLGFDGLGDLFNEPEVETPASPVGDNPQASNNSVGNGFLAGSISESDPDEVDDTNSPVSVESCLGHFTRSEFLSREHAWHCENCSKLELEEKRRMRKNRLKFTPMVPTNPSDDHHQCSSSEVVQVRSHPYSESLESCTNGSSYPDENLKGFGTEKTNGVCSVSTDGKEGNSEHKDTSSNGVVDSTWFGPSDEESLAGGMSGAHCMLDNNVPHKRMHGLSEGQESENDEEEVDSKGVKVMREATKRILIEKAPPVMTIHLKRFCQDPRGRLSKLNGYICFGEYLDVGPYLDPRCSHQEKEEGNIYRLIGVVEHSGSMRGGHYVAYVRRRGAPSHKRTQQEDQQRGGGWYYASDAHVREVSFDEVLRCEAYLLFYERLRP